MLPESGSVVRSIDSERHRAFISLLRCCQLSTICARLFSAVLFFLLVALLLLLLALLLLLLALFLPLPLLLLALFLLLLLRKHEEGCELGSALQLFQRSNSVDCAASGLREGEKRREEEKRERKMKNKKL